MANYRYKVYQGRKLVSETTTKREAEKEVYNKPTEWYVLDTDTGSKYKTHPGGRWGRVRAWKRSNPTRAGGTDHVDYRYKVFDGRKQVAESTTKKEAEEAAKKLGKGRGSAQDVLGGNVFDYSWSHYRGREMWSWHMADATGALLGEADEAGHPKTFDELEYERLAIEAAREALTTPGGSKRAIAAMVEATKHLPPEARRRAMAASAQGAVARGYADREQRFTPKRNNPRRRHRNPNDANHPDYVAGFYAGIQAVADASSYFSSRRKNPDAAGNSLEYQAGFVAAVQLLGSHLISDTEAAWATVEALSGGAGIAPPPRRPAAPRPGGGTPRPSAPRPSTPRPSAPRPATAGLTPLEAQILETLPDDGSIMSSSEIFGAWEVSGLNVWVGLNEAKLTAGKSEEKIKNKINNLYNAATRGLREKGLIEKVGAGRWSGWRLTSAGSSAETTGVGAGPAPAVPQVGIQTDDDGNIVAVAGKPVKPKAPKAATGSLWSEPAWLKAQAYMTSKGASSELIAKKFKAAKDLADAGKQVAIVYMSTGSGTPMIGIKEITPDKDLAYWLAAIPDDLRFEMPEDYNSPVVPLTLSSNPFYGKGRGRFWGAWG